MISFQTVSFMIGKTKKKEENMETIFLVWFHDERTKLSCSSNPI